ncbi:MAG: class I SAM-dependent methyltransferase [Anaerolineales bacterium]|jgi:SAM-dependent methyltransferase
MSYFDEIDKAQAYIKMTEEYDGRELIDILLKYLPRGASVLELGMGPGKDLDLLRKNYQATGSDSAQTFLDIYQKENKAADLLLLDARTLETDRKFDGIYSNKVLIHLSEDELWQSFQRQKAILNPGGVLLHSFWEGDNEEYFDGLRFGYYRKERLLAMVEPRFDVLEIKSYAEKESGDSIYLVLKESKVNSQKNDQSG